MKIEIMYIYSLLYSQYLTCCVELLMLKSGTPTPSLSFTSCPGTTCLGPLLNPNFLGILWASNLMTHFLLYISQT